MILFNHLFLLNKKRNYINKKIKDLDQAVKSIFHDPKLGQMKVGDLSGVQVYKYKSGNQQVLLVYEVIDSILYLYNFGSHENFSRKFKIYLQ